MYVSLRELKLSVAAYSRQFDEKRKPALLGKHRYLSAAIRYKVAGYVEEIVVRSIRVSRILTDRSIARGLIVTLGLDQKMP